VKALCVVLALALGGQAQAWEVAHLKAPRRTIIKPDGNTVAHVYWNGAALVDTKRNAWTATGTPTAVPSSPPVPAGATGFTVGAFYGLGAGADALDFAGDFSVCVVFSFINAVAAQLTLVSAGNWNVAGWYLIAYNSGGVTFATNTAGAESIVVPANGAIAGGGINVACGGRAGATLYAKTNLGAIASAPAGTITPATSLPTRIGHGNGTTDPAVNTTIHEVWASTTPPSDALFVAVQQSVKAKLQITAW
jgi:hypothetical protein